MVSRSRKREARTERRANAQADTPKPTRAKVDPISNASRMGRKTIRTLDVLDKPRRDVTRPVSANENPGRDWQARMGQVTEAIKERQRLSIDRLNAAHAKATNSITPPRPNAKMASQSGTIRAAETKTSVAGSKSKKPEPLRSDQTLRDAPTCKERPEKTRGMGTGRHFVPWCGRRS